MISYAELFLIIWASIATCAAVLYRTQLHRSIHAIHSIVSNEDAYKAARESYLAFTRRVEDIKRRNA